MKKEFRSDINTLRTIAVTLVVLYHFEIAGFQNGFIGVDIFFVISGYLMTKIICDSIDGDRFSFSNFYTARVIRIIPVLLVLCVALLIFGYIYFLPSEYKTLGKHVISSLLFFSNVTYFFESGYFDIASREKWLLHSWSLSVEWQFYLLYPVLIVLAHKLKGRVASIALVAMACACSLMISIYDSYHHPSAGFYLLQSRFWELGAGGLTFFLTNVSRFRLQHSIFRMFGYTLILLSMVLLDSSQWPGIKAIVPVVGTCLVILANDQSFYLNRSKLVAYLGLSSYSIYLWHWPLVVVYSSYFQIENIQYLLVLLAFAVGCLSYRYIELPVQRYYKAKKGHVINRNLEVVAASGLILVFTSFVYLSGGYKDRVPDNVRLADDARWDRNTEETKSLSLFSNTIKSAGVLLVGDSFAAAVADTVESVVTESDRIRRVIADTVSSIREFIALDVKPAERMAAMTVKARMTPPVI